MSIQEDVNHRSISLSVRAAKLTGRTLLKVIQAYLRHRKNQQLRPDIPQGKQTVKQLAKQGQGMTSLDINDKDIKLFDRIMKKFAVDYAVMKDKTTSPPTHTIFFKSKDADAIEKAFKNFTKQVTNKISKPSVVSELKRLTLLVKNTVKDRVKNKDKEQSL